MTGSAVVDYPGMIEGGRDKTIRIMTNSAVLVGRDMIARFGFGQTGVVTGSTVIDDADVVKCCR